MDKITYTVRNENQAVRDNSSIVERVLEIIEELSPEETNHVLIKVIEFITKNRANRIEELRVMQSSLERANKELIDVIRENLQ
jgi:hypothetical protein